MPATPALSGTNTTSAGAGRGAAPSEPQIPVGTRVRTKLERIGYLHDRHAIVCDHLQNGQLKVTWEAEGESVFMPFWPDQLEVLA